MEDESPFDIWSWELSARPWPRLNCQNILLERRPQLLRAGRRRAQKLILICHIFDLEERWVNWLSPSRFIET